MFGMLADWTNAQVLEDRIPLPLYTYITDLVCYSLPPPNSIIRNNKCIFSKLNAAFLYSKWLYEPKIFFTTVNPVANTRFSKLLFSPSVP